MSDDEIDACIWPGLIDCLNDPFDSVGNGDDFSSCYVDLRKFARAVLAANDNKTNLSSNVELSGAERSEGRQKRKLLAVRLNELLGTQANRKHTAAEAKVTGGAKAEMNLNCAAPKLHCKLYGHRMRCIK